MILVAFGSNLSFCRRSPAELVSAALSAMGRIVAVRKVSPFYSTPAWPNADDPRFVNAVACVETSLSPAALLAALHAIEAGFGRRRSQRNAPRTLDLDLLAYRDVIRRADETSPLILPHPGLSERDFVLAPLEKTAPDWRHPETGLTPGEMLAALPVNTAERLQ